MATSANPDPAHISKAMWWLWTTFHKREPRSLLGGIYGDKPGYHNTRAGNWSGDYSVGIPLDRKGPSNKAAAIDITFPDAQAGNYKTINQYSKRLLAAGRDPKDERTKYLREFFGQIDADSDVEGWDFFYDQASTSDQTHLWHIHISFLRAYVNDMKAMRAVFSILAGQTVTAWRAVEKRRLVPKKVPPAKPVKPAAKPKPKKP